MLREQAPKTQIIVLTCRPLDYLRAEELPAAGEAFASRAAGIVRAVDLSRIIARSDSAELPSTQGGG